MCFKTLILYQLLVQFQFLNILNFPFNKLNNRTNRPKNRETKTAPKQTIAAQSVQQRR